jgi:hypothetical protein
VISGAAARGQHSGLPVAVSAYCLIIEKWNSKVFQQGTIIASRLVGTFAKKYNAGEYMIDAIPYRPLGVVTNIAQQLQNLAQILSKLDFNSRSRYL